MFDLGVGDVNVYIMLDIKNYLFICGLILEVVFVLTFFFYI